MNLSDTDRINGQTSTKPGQSQKRFFRGRMLLPYRVFTSHFFDSAARSGRNKRTRTSPVRRVRHCWQGAGGGRGGMRGRRGRGTSLELMKFSRARFPQVVTCGPSLRHILCTSVSPPILLGWNVLISTSLDTRAGVMSEKPIFAAAPLPVLLMSIVWSFCSLNVIAAYIELWRRNFRAAASS